jgi:hypothetical protein
MGFREVIERNAWLRLITAVGDLDFARGVMRMCYFYL